VSGPGKSGPMSAEERRRRAELLDDDAWIRESRRTLADLARYLRKKLADESLDPVVAIGAYRALAETVNDRDSILEGDDDPAPTTTPTSGEGGSR
jgi:hypothetical protein